MRPRDESLVSGANAKFLMADFRGLDTDPPPLVGMGLTQADLDNRWYLMFSMLEVPSRVHRQFGNPLLNLDRVPGKINLNTIRHPQILAALLDDPLVVDVDTIADANGSTLDESGAVDSSPLPSNPLAGNRGDWWQEFIASRDGAFSPPSGGHTLYIPGIPGSKPFEPFGHMGGTNFTLSPVSVAAEVPGQDQERTLLRTLFTDFSDPNGDGRDENNAGRRLFEVGTPADFEGPAAGGTIGMTPETRHRLLSKVLNNSTTSSNTFVVHMTIGYFEVFEDPSTGAVRIGGEYDITPGDGQPASLNRKRSVFLLDRSEAPRAFDAGTQQFDYRRLIKHEVTIQ